MVHNPTSLAPANLVAILIPARIVSQKATSIRTARNRINLQGALMIMAVEMAAVVTTMAVMTEEGKTATRMVVARTGGTGARNTNTGYLASQVSRPRGVRAGTRTPLVFRSLNS